MDIASLVYFRVVFGVVMLCEVLRYAVYGWIESHYISPTFHFTYDGFHWVHPWKPGWLMYAHFALLGVLAVCIAAGLFYRLAMAGFFLAFSYVFLLDKAYGLNHFYLIVLLSFLMIFIPAHRAGSIDAWRRPSLRSNVAPAWALWLLRLQVGIPYLYGGIAKLNGDWLRGEPMRMWLAGTPDFPLIGGLFTQEWMAYLFSYGGLLLDLLILPALLWRRTRPWAIAAGVAFHLMNARLFHIGIFPWLMLGALGLYLDPSWPRRAFRLLLPPGMRKDERPSPRPLKGKKARSLLNNTGKTPPIAAAGVLPPPWQRRWVTGLFLAWFAAQCLIPLRHYLYPGNVMWTEEGHRFAWHMKLRDKQGTAQFFATDPATGQTWEIDLRDRLNPRQRAWVALQPDMILQFARHLAAELRAQGREGIQIRVQTAVSLNGRKPQPLIDPSVDLASINAPPLAHWPWILPLTEPLPAPFAKRSTGPPETADE